MRYKVGTKVRINSLDWYDANKNENGNVNIGATFVGDMAEYCGTICIISSVHEKYYELCTQGGRHINFSWSPEFFTVISEHSGESTKEEIIDSLDQQINNIERTLKGERYSDRSNTELAKELQALQEYRRKIQNI